MMNDEEKALAAWQAYKVVMRDHPRRQLRRREFIAGYLEGIRVERKRTQKYVVPANLTVYELVRTLDDNPYFLSELQEQIPETLTRLATFLRTGKAPKEKK
jgi:hypothetical protein